ncbi:MAG TPA: ribosome maturation factor RimM [Xanthobacteraceae bacterium]|nr:ribosome maturation factor RimM [Xanthobacteraceae bacterium]
MARQPRSGEPTDAGRHVLVGRIGAAHGVRGDVKLWSFTEDPAAIAGYGPFTDVAGARTFEIAHLRPAKDFFVARFKGLEDRTAAEALCNTDLYVPRERLPAPQDDDEFYMADLVGLAAVDAAGATVGTVVAVQNFGAGDLLELRHPSRNVTAYLPFSRAFVPKVDVAGGRIEIAAPADLFETPARPPGEPV